MNINMLFETLFFFINVKFFEQETFVSIIKIRNAKFLIVIFLI